jgi:hypothetical protein
MMGGISRSLFLHNGAILIKEKQINCGRKEAAANREQRPEPVGYIYVVQHTVSGVRFL